MLSLSQLARGQVPVGSYSHIGHDDLNVVPIDPNWILEGSPVSRVKRLHVADDLLYEVALWECNQGRFRWYFGCDEVVHILDGQVTVREDDGTERTLRAGDTALFPRGSSNIWYVDTFVRKIATLRYHKPTPVDFVKRVVRRGQRELTKLYSQVKSRAA